MEPSLHRLVSTEDQVTFIETGPAHSDYPPVTTPADRSMSDAENSTTPNETAFRLASGYAETFQRLLQPMLAESGVYIQTAKETFDVHGHLVHSVKPTEVCIPELGNLRACCDEKQAEINRIKEQLDAAKDEHRVSSEAQAKTIASLIDQLLTVTIKSQDLSESLVLEKDLVAAQAARIGKWTAMYHEAEDERKRQEDEAEQSALSARTWWEKCTWVEVENEKLKKGITEIREEITECRQELRRARRENVRWARGPRGVLLSVIRNKEQLETELGKAQKKAEEAVEALGREKASHDEMKSLAAKKMSEVDNVRKNATAQAQAAARDKATVEKKLDDALDQLEKIQLELSNARNEVQESQWEPLPVHLAGSSSHYGGRPEDSDQDKTFAP